MPEVDPEVIRAQTRNETYRARARPVASLTAAAAAALSAALVFSPGRVLDFWVQVLGLGAVACLVLSTSALVIASLAHVVPGRATLFDSWFLWRMRVDGQSGGPMKVEDALDQAGRVLRRILRLIEAGLIAAGVALLFLALALVINVAEDNRVVSVVVTDQEAFSSVCLGSPSSFVATVSTAVLRSESSHLLVRVPDSECGLQGARDIFVSREAIQSVQGSQ